jgi:uncharacterized protein (DUF2062 family)
MLERVGNLWQGWVIKPVKGLLRAGLTPEKLAWSLAAGVVVGVNPLLGSTTLLALGVAAALRLNVVASQVGNHAVYPLELALFPVFVKLGSVLFETERLPLDGKELWWAARHHPWDTTRVLWSWEWHALVVWAVFAAVAIPLLALAFRPALEKMHRHLNRPVTV